MLAAIPFRIAKEYLMVVLFFNSKVRVFENTMLRRMFGPERDEMTGGWRRRCIPRSLMICTLH
jgi:hypothetical protein